MASSTPGAALKAVGVGVYVTFAVDGTEADSRKLEKLRCGTQLRRFAVLDTVTCDREHSLEMHEACAVVQRRVRGMRARRRFRGLVDVIIAEVRHRADAVAARAEHVNRIFGLFLVETVKALNDEEKSERHRLFLAERRSFLKVCEVRLVEIRGREELYREQLERQEERARFEVTETIARLRVLFNSRVAWNGVLQWHRHDFRMLWDRFYVALAAHQALLEIANEFRAKEGVVLAPDAITPLPPPPTDYDFASAFVAFPREVRAYALSLTRDANLAM